MHYIFYFFKRFCVVKKKKISFIKENIKTGDKFKILNRKGDFFTRWEKLTKKWDFFCFKFAYIFLTFPFDTGGFSSAFYTPGFTLGDNLPILACNISNCFDNRLTSDVWVWNAQSSGFNICDHNSYSNHVIIVTMIFAIYAITVFLKINYVFILSKNTLKLRRVTLCGSVCNNNNGGK